MEDTAKYLIHGAVTANGVVERSDVVGAIFGQTEGLLGEELDLRDLRRSSQVGRIDVEVTSEHGRSEGTLTIATSLDKVETATLAASLETITHVGPCRATIEIREIEDVRAAKRREVVERAKELLEIGFDDSVMSSEEILAEVRQHVRVEDITAYEGLPAGPRVEDSDAIIVVEGRADVLTLLRYGVKNAVAVEGTDVPEAIAELTTDRTVTAFLDGDRGGDLILEELAQVGDIDYVAFAPAGKSVEDLDHHRLFTALRNKVPYDTVSGMTVPREAVAATDGSVKPAPPQSNRQFERTESTEKGDEAEAKSEAEVEVKTEAEAEGDVKTESESGVEANVDADVDTGSDSDTDVDEKAPADVGERAESPSGTGSSTRTDARASASGVERTAVETAADATSGGGEKTRSDFGEETTSGEAANPTTVYDHATAVIRGDTDRVRFLDESDAVIEEAEAGDAYDLLDSIQPVPTTMILDSIAGQQLVDVAADRGVERIVARSLGQFTKRPTSVSVHAIDDVAERAPEN